MSSFPLTLRSLCYVLNFWQLEICTGLAN